MEAENDTPNLIFDLPPHPQKIDFQGLTTCKPSLQNLPDRFSGLPFLEIIIFHSGWTPKIGGGGDGARGRGGALLALLKRVIGPVILAGSTPAGQN